jgi:hypothetical protein
MRVLLDEMLPAGVSGLLPDHQVRTVQQAGFKGLRNGELLLTADRYLPAQQNITVFGIAVVLVRGSRMSQLTPQAGRIEAAVARARPGVVTRVEPS